MRANAPWLTGTAIAVAAIAALPTLAVVTRGVAPGAGATWEHLLATTLPEMVANTLWLLLLVGVGVIVGGTACGWLLARHRFPGSRVFEWALLLPLAMPAYVMAYAYTDFLEYAGPVQSALRASFGLAHGDYWFPDVRTVPGAAVIFIFALFPYVYLLTRVAFLERPRSLAEAARTLGLDRRQAFLRVDLPLARPAIAAGAALALMETLADFGTVSYFAVPTFTTGIYRAWFNLGDRAAAAQLASALLVFVVTVLILERVSRGAGRTYAAAHGRAVTDTVRETLRGVPALAATGVCTIAVTVGFALPVAILLRLIHADPEIAFDARFATWMGHTLVAAGVAAGVCAVLAIVVAYALRLNPGWPMRAASRVLTLGYAVPGTVLAVGVLLPLGTIDAVYADWRRSVTGVAPGLLLTGTIVALVYAYVVRYFAVAWNAVEPGFARITPAMDAAARSLGVGAAGTLVRVHAPLLARSVAAALLLSFVDVMKELPATLILRPFNFDTLATQAYQLARDERLAEAAVPSLAIVVVGLVPIVLLARLARRDAQRAPLATAATLSAQQGG
ncbi:MAG: iron ABC transporter permease [Burkholderiales bacterium]|nr:iron ABC transporter permease [Burkholderiales bacterium]